MRNHGLYEAAQTLARLEQIVAEARARFDAQDARVSQDLGELARRVAAAPAPSLVQPQAVTFQAAPAPSMVTSPGGTVRFYPGGPADGIVLTPAPAAGYTTPQRPARQQQQQPQPTQPQQQPPQPTQPASTSHDAWAPWAAARGVSPQGQ